jgi:hypothetical protein
MAQRANLSDPAERINHRLRPFDVLRPFEKSPRKTVKTDRFCDLKGAQANACAASEITNNPREFFKGAQTSQRGAALLRTPTYEKWQKDLGQKNEAGLAMASLSSRTGKERKIKDRKILQAIALHHLLVRNLLVKRI